MLTQIIEHYQMKLSYQKQYKIIKVKIQKEFKEKYQDDNRFEFYKVGRTEMIRIK